MKLADFVLEHAFGEFATAELENAWSFFAKKVGATSTQEVVARPSEQVVSASLELVGKDGDELGVCVGVIVAFCPNMLERGLGCGVRDDEPIFVAVGGGL